MQQGIPHFDDLAAQRQWQLEHMAAAFRHWAREGYVEGISGHISVRDPEHTDAFWTNPLGVHFGLLKASDMILVVSSVSSEYVLVLAGGNSFLVMICYWLQGPPKPTDSTKKHIRAHHTLWLCQFGVARLSSVLANE